MDAKIRSHGEDELADVGELGARATLMPKMTIDLAATKILNITVTKSFLHLLTNLGDVSFSLKYNEHIKTFPNECITFDDRKKVI